MASAFSARTRRSLSLSTPASWAGPRGRGLARCRSRPSSTTMSTSLPDARGPFGPFGGQFVPETLMTALAELEEAYRQAQEDDLFQRRLSALLRDYAGRPTPLHCAENLPQ